MRTLPETAPVDPRERTDLLLRDLRASRQGLSRREAERRLLAHGPNRLARRGGRRWPGDLLRQLTQPLAVLLFGAAALAAVAGIAPIAIAVLVVIALNAGFAFVQERQAERAVEALSGYLAERATVLRDGRETTIDAVDLVPGDVMLIAEGERISADAHLLEGTVEIDASTLTGESVPVERSAGASPGTVPLPQAPELVFSGTACTGGAARALVFATGMGTELGRIAALSQRVEAEESPLEREVRRVSLLIAGVAVAMGLAFVPIAALGAGLSVPDSIVLAIGLIVGNVPEGLLPVITLALAAGVAALARRGAVVKRLSAVETLGSTDVICTDKTGTLTENRMRVAGIWSGGHRVEVHSGIPARDHDSNLLEMLTAMVTCNDARRDEDGELVGDPTEVAMLATAGAVGIEPEPARRLAEYRFDPALKRMSTLDGDGGRLWINAKGAPEALLPLCARIAVGDGRSEPLAGARLGEVQAAVEDFAGAGLRVLAVARRPAERRPRDRAEAERDLVLLGLVALYDPPRPEVAAAVAGCHEAGIRIVVITGDHPRTAVAIAAGLGIGDPEPRAITEAELEGMSDAELAAVLRRGEPIFARSTPEAKLRIADALREQRHVVAMTGDGVNDAPALRAADIGVAMGRSGTDVAREAATMVLTDDNFATIVAAIAAGRRIYDNIRKFIVYIFAHLTPELAPFLVFGLGGGAIPLPLTVLQLLAFDVGTETLPALALGREAAEPGIMRRPPRPRAQGLVTRGMLARAWLFLGVISAALSMGAFFYVLARNGWHPGADTAAGSPLHEGYRQATTMTFLSMVACQVGTAFAARTERASLRSVGVLSNRLLLVGIAFELALAGLLIYVPGCQELLGTAALPAKDLLLVAPFPFLVWGADEARRRWLRRRRGGEPDRRRRPARSTPLPSASR